MLSTSLVYLNFELVSRKKDGTTVIFFYQSTAISVKIRTHVKYTIQTLMGRLRKTYGVLTYFQAYVYLPANDPVRKNLALLF